METPSTSPIPALAPVVVAIVAVVAIARAFFFVDWSGVDEAVLDVIRNETTVKTPTPAVGTATEETAPAANN